MDLTQINRKHVLDEDYHTWAFLSEFDELPGTMGLEIGCNYSLLTPILAKHQYKMTGVDCDEYQLNPRLNQLLNEPAIMKMRHASGSYSICVSAISPEMFFFHNATIQSLGYAKDIFDFVICLDTLHHLGTGSYLNDEREEPGSPQYDIETMHHIRDWLKPLGRLFLTVPVGPSHQSYPESIVRVYDSKALEYLTKDFVTISRWAIGWNTNSWRIKDPSQPRHMIGDPAEAFSAGGTMFVILEKR